MFPVSPHHCVCLYYTVMYCAQFAPLHQQTQCVNSRWITSLFNCNIIDAAVDIEKKNVCSRCNFSVIFILWGKNSLSFVQAFHTFLVLFCFLKNVINYVKLNSFQSFSLETTKRSSRRWGMNDDEWLYSRWILWSSYVVSWRKMRKF